MTPTPDIEATRAERRQRAEARRRAADAELAALDADVSGPLDQVHAADRRAVRARAQIERATADLAAANADRTAAIAAIRAMLAPYVVAGASLPAVAAAHGLPEGWVRPTSTEAADSTGEADTVEPTMYDAFSPGEDPDEEAAL